jgi:hypothetical protein
VPCIDIPSEGRPARDRSDPVGSPSQVMAWRRTQGVAHEPAASRRALLRPVVGLGAAWLLVGSAGLAGCAARRAPPAPPATGPATPEASAPPRDQPALPGPIRARDWAEFRVLAAQRLVLANPGRVYLGEVQQPLLAIPVLEIELRGDGRVRRIEVLRRPSQALDTIDLAIAAVHRAAPFGDVSRLPRPWKFVEVFLFNEERRFKPRTLDV